MDRELPDALRFPVPWGPQASDEQLAESVRAIVAWRDRVEHALRHERAALPVELTDRAVARMLQILTPTPCEHMPLFRLVDSSPRLSLDHMQPFPATVDLDRHTLYDLMQWRADFIEYLDVVDTPAHRHRDCGALKQFLGPPDADQRCFSCLALLSERRYGRSYHVCLLHEYVTATWPRHEGTSPAAETPTAELPATEPPTADPRVTWPRTRPAVQALNTTTDRFTSILAGAKPERDLDRRANAGPERDLDLVYIALAVGVLLCIFATLAPASSPRLLVAGLGLAMLLVAVLLRRRA